MEQQTAGNIPVLVGKKCVLGLIRKSQLETLLRWTNDQEVSRFLLRRFPMTESVELEWLERLGRDDTHIVLGIYSLDGDFVGTMGLHGIDWASRVATTGTMIGESKYWGKGIGTDAKMSFLKYAFDTLNLRKICSSVLAFNGRSLAYAEKCGYKPEGIRRVHIFKDGAYHDEHLLAVFREDWHPRWEHYQQHGTLKGFAA